MEVTCIHGRLREKLVYKVKANTLGTVAGYTEGKVDVNITAIINEKPKPLNVSVKPSGVEKQETKDSLR